MPKQKSTREVQAGPTKGFFVKMLTRDIELGDAIIDLLDNCIDGVLRQNVKSKPKRKSKKPYEGYWAKITVKPNKFEILDNCGGISVDIAENSAFRLGRPDAGRDGDLETVGVYGIGMKRAIFKMGRECSVISQPNTGTYEVRISPEWIEADDNWNLQLTENVKQLRNNGTKITITDIYDSVGKQFDNDQSPFVKELKNNISAFYALIIEKGFEVFVNNALIKPRDLTILTPKKIAEGNSPKIEPYIFEGQLDGVSVNVVVGFYRKLAKDQELNDDIMVRRSREQAGWTIICNDRVVLYNDKSSMTGWGTAGVPGYHNQFISIAGTVSFQCTDSLKLPLNTTKRGIDMSSEVYLTVLDFMREGLKKFTSFTNHWKSREDETDENFSELNSYKVTKVSMLVPEEEFSQSRRLTGTKRGRYYSPNLPKPEDRHRTRRISFAANEEDIQLVGEYYYDDPSHDRAEIGRRCFDESLSEAKESLK